MHTFTNVFNGIVERETHRGGLVLEVAIKKQLILKQHFVLFILFKLIRNYSGKLKYK